MSFIDTKQLDLLYLEECIWVLTKPIHIAVYDFNLAEFFNCRRSLYREDEIKVIARIGAIKDYKQVYQQLAAEGIQLIHSPEQYDTASNLQQWYPIIKDLTPYSKVFTEFPSFEELADTFGLPFFLKGNRQTHGHNKALSIITSYQQYQAAIKVYQSDPILHWQSIVVREFVPLRPLEIQMTNKIPPSFEFRTFWWYGDCIALGPYWSQDYRWSAEEEYQALKIASIAAKHLALPFVVIDIAQTQAGEWIVIECNDAQESGYAGISPFSLWQNLIHKIKQDSYN